MQLFDVYPLYDITPVRAQGAYLWDEHGQRYLDLYGGHAVISIGHTHSHYVQRLTAQLEQLGFYSNAVQNPLQIQLAEHLGRLSGYDDYALFLCSSGAEANENALKLASFHTQKPKVVAFKQAFHGRTSAAVAATDNPKIVAPINAVHDTHFAPWGDEAYITDYLAQHNDVAAVIIEGIQGVGGIHIPGLAFLQALRRLCTQHGIVLILDEIQSGYGRSGRFFAHQYADIRPDLITVAKGMGNGFPVAGVLIAPHIKPWHGMLGTTFGGNHLACVAGLAVLEVIEQEQLIDKAAALGQSWMQALAALPGIAELRGLGLMIGLELVHPVAPVRKRLLEEFHIFTGVSGSHTLRLLPPLNVPEEATTYFVEALGACLSA
ncbi:aspartate aminotransferase family protein [Eisenibacter elegans]|uniref:aspartate aminotransferase family protein n=1 Tax=Eisenibacter elegans TaxID=997 RepID=UPI00041C6BEA|nr:aminotransferase class III-fold pyridoxal phosphate-dependent enzyme [Eisenibacter elegans]